MNETESRYCGKMLLIRAQIETGRRLQEDLGTELREEFEKNTCVDLSKKYGVASRYASLGGSESSAVRTVEFAIRGNSNADYGPVYGPLIDEAHRRELVSQRSGDRARTKVATLLAGRGVIPWAQDEAAFIWLLSGEERATYTEMARQSNLYFHEGKPVRNRNSIKRCVKKLEDAWVKNNKRKDCP